MLDLKVRTGKVTAAAAARTLLLLLALTLAASLAACKSGGGSLDEANQLNRSAGEDIKEIEKIVKDNKDKEGEVTRAVNAGDYDRARKVMDDSLQAIDRGLERGQSAVEKFDRASKLDVDPTIKEYLSLRAQSVNKAVEAFRELRAGVVSYRDGVGQTDRAAAQKGKREIRQASEKFDALISESHRLEGQADDIARRNPDKIKPGS